MSVPTPRQMWEAVERYHGSCYVEPEPRAAATAAGLKGFWMNYFATRAAPLGPVPARVVEATFFYYAPAPINRAIPDAWSLASPANILDARYQGMDAALRRLLGTDVVGSAQLAEAADLVHTAVAELDTMGRVLAAGWASLPWPTEPHVALWHGCTVLREHRSGSHLMALAASGLDGCESVVSQVAVDDAPQVWVLEEAKWSESDAAAATDRLRRRGWVDDLGRATDAGRAGRYAVEELTDELDSRHWNSVGAIACNRLLELMNGLSRSLPHDDQLDWHEVYGPNDWS